MKYRLAVGAMVALLLLLLIATPVMAERDASGSLLFQDFTLEPGDELYNDLATFGGRIHLKRDTLVHGNVAILGGEGRFEGQINGDVVVMGGSVELMSTAVVNGDLVVFGRLRRYAGSQVHGSVVEGARTRTFQYIPRLLNGRPGIDLPGSVAMHRVEPVDWLARLARGLGTIVGLLFLAALIAVVMPDSLSHVAQVMRQSAPICFVVGLLTVVLTPLLIGLLSIICVGLPLAIVLGLAFLAAGLVGWVAAGQIVGHFCLQVVKVHGQSTLVETLLGVLLLALISSVGLLGVLLFLLVWMWGLGSVLLTRFGRIDYPANVSPASQPMQPATAAPAPTAATATTAALDRAQDAPVEEPPMDNSAPKGETKPLEPREWLDDEDQAES
ncbi:MAG: polymer-forming cytoskeletal protein [Chloroflexi bacterium]|nr:polymer-forming cytoskeletal protein [Chloroflexota bacterium]